MKSATGDHMKGAHDEIGHGPKYYTTSDWLGPGNAFENVMKGGHDEIGHGRPHDRGPR